MRVRVVIKLLKTQRYCDKMRISEVFFHLAISQDARASLFSSLRPALEPNIFPSGPSHSVNKYIFFMALCLLRKKKQTNLDDPANSKCFSFPFRVRVTEVLLCMFATVYTVFYYHHILLLLG